jgi:hypothetical protein
MMMRQTGLARAPFSRAHPTDRCRQNVEMGRRRSPSPRAAPRSTHGAATIGDYALAGPAVSTPGPPCAPFRSVANYMATLRARSRSSNRSIASKAMHLPTDFRENRSEPLARTAHQCCVGDRTQGETARKFAMAFPQMRGLFLGTPQTYGAAQDGRTPPATRASGPAMSLAGGDLARCAPILAHPGPRLVHFGSQPERGTARSCEVPKSEVPECQSSEPSRFSIAPSPSDTA